MSSVITHSTLERGERQVVIHGHHLIEVDALDSLGLCGNNGIFEPVETALCRQLINRGDRVLDIGANIGYYTLLFCDLVFPDGCVTAIEPDRENFGFLQRNLSKQFKEGLVALRQCALGEKNHKAQLFHAEENGGMHRLYSSVCCGTDSFEVIVIKGDSLDLAPLNFIKIDIEGYEPFALRGLASTLQQSPLLKILCEFSPLSLWEADFSPIVFLGEMRDLGFHLLVQDEQAWKKENFDEIIWELQLIPASALAHFISSLESADGNQRIAQQALTFLERHGYRRPLLENILFVAPGAWQTVCASLAIRGPESEAISPPVC